MSDMFLVYCTNCGLFCDIEIKSSISSVAQPLIYSLISKQLCYSLVAIFQLLAGKKSTFCSRILSLAVVLPKETGVDFLLLFLTLTVIVFA